MTTKESGFILPITTVFLLMLASLSLTSMHTALMQQKVVRNQSTSVVALEHAERALKAIEYSDLLQDITKIRETAGYHHTFNSPSSAPDFLVYNWLTPGNAFPAPSWAVTPSDDQLTLPTPLVVLEELYFSQDHGDSDHSPLTHDSAYRYIRITVHVSDKLHKDVAVLQSVVEQEYEKNNDAEPTIASYPHRVSRVSWRQLR